LHKLFLIPALTSNAIIFCTSETFLLLYDDAMSLNFHYFGAGTLLFVQLLFTHSAPLYNQVKLPFIVGSFVNYISQKKKL